MKKKEQKSSPPPVSAGAESSVKATFEKAVPSFTDTGLRMLMAELAAARVARVARNHVLSGKLDGSVLQFLLPDRDELDRLKQFAAQVASMERGACLDIAKEIISKEQHEPLASALCKRGPLGFTMSVEWKPETQLWLAK